MVEADALRRYKAEIFQALAHPTRVHIAECLLGGEMSVNALLEKTGVSPANLSQHLTLMRSRQLVVKRREGTQVIYALGNPVLAGILTEMRTYFQSHIADSMALLRNLEAASGE